ncbi:RusA-like resolvase [Microbacterium phage Megan]|uniref:RusA-like resolvase n=1 Tax=Microbacterium phage Megan TaxID=2656551 RepID=A0A649VKR5_9CAUD|nr:RusA-like resolvase [Microbacterium phage Megan]QGJ92715.1 RusA-like resolvase [Microbacterium phage Megan]
MSPEHTLALDWTSPPLTENQRLNRWERARRVRDVRATTALWGRRIRGARRVEVILTWVVADARKRDEDNVVPTLKALCDGLVDAGVVPDDTPRYMVKRMPVVALRRGARPHMELLVRVLDVPTSDVSASMTTEANASQRKAEA